MQPSAARPQRPPLVTFLVIGNLVLAALAVGSTVATLAVIVARASGAGIACTAFASLIPLLFAAGMAHTAVGLSRATPRAASRAAGLVTAIATIPLLAVLRGGYELIDKQTTRWEFFLPGLAATAALIGYRALLRSPTVTAWTQQARG